MIFAALFADSAQRAAPQLSAPHPDRCAVRYGERNIRAPQDEGDLWLTEIQQFFRDHGISEVEAIIPDMAGIARGKIMPAEKFAEDEGMRLPESIFLQTVTGDYPPDTS